MYRMRSKIYTQTMASVAVIYTIRQFVSSTALTAYGLLAAFIATASLVSVGDVVQNFLAVGLSGAGHFIVFAISHTATPVQFFSFATVLFAGLLVRSFVAATRRTSPRFI